MINALNKIFDLFSGKSAAERRGDALIEAGYDLGLEPSLAPVLRHPTAEPPFWGCRVHGRSGPCHDCLIEDEFPADEPPPLPPNCVAASQMFPQHTRTK